MRTTYPLRMSAELHEQVRALAFYERRSMNETLLALVREALSTKNVPPPAVLPGQLELDPK